MYVFLDWRSHSVKESVEKHYREYNKTVNGCLSTRQSTLQSPITPHLPTNISSVNASYWYIDYNNTWSACHFSSPIMCDSNYVDALQYLTFKLHLLFSCSLWKWPCAYISQLYWNMLEQWYYLLTAYLVIFLSKESVTESNVLHIDFCYIFSKCNYISFLVKIMGMKMSVKQHCGGIIPTVTNCWNDGGLMLGQRRRRWPNIKPPLVQRMIWRVCGCEGYGEVWRDNCPVKTSTIRWWYQRSTIVIPLVVHWGKPRGFTPPIPPPRAPPHSHTLSWRSHLHNLQVKPPRLTPPGPPGAQPGSCHLSCMVSGECAFFSHLAMSTQQHSWPPLPPTRRDLKMRFKFIRSTYSHTSTVTVYIHLIKYYNVCRRNASTFYCAALRSQKAITAYVKSM